MNDNKLHKGDENNGGAFVGGLEAALVGGIILLVVYIVSKLIGGA